jgi:hypothetical protein
LERKNRKISGGIDNFMSSDMILRTFAIHICFIYSILPAIAYTQCWQLVFYLSLLSNINSTILLAAFVVAKSISSFVQVSLGYDTSDFENKYLLSL